MIDQNMLWRHTGKEWKASFYPIILNTAMYVYQCLKITCFCPNLRTCFKTSSDISTMRFNSLNNNDFFGVYIYFFLKPTQCANYLNIIQIKCKPGIWSLGVLEVEPGLAELRVEGILLQVEQAEEVGTEINLLLTLKNYFFRPSVYKLVKAKNFCNFLKYNF